MVTGEGGRQPLGNTINSYQNITGKEHPSSTYLTFQIGLHWVQSWRYLHGAINYLVENAAEIQWKWFGVQVFEYQCNQGENRRLAQTIIMVTLTAVHKCRDVPRNQWAPSEN